MKQEDLNYLRSKHPSPELLCYLQEVNEQDGSHQEENSHRDNREKEPKKTISSRGDRK